MDKNEIAIDKGPAFGMRHVQVGLLYLCLVSNYLGRHNAPVSVVAMTNANSTNPDFPEFDWNEKQKSYILSSFFWGYVFTQFLASYVCRQFGSKTSMLIPTLGSAVLSLITPVAVGFGGWQIYCGIRTTQGLVQGMMMPTLHDHLAKWAPIEERTRLGALTLTGVETGNILAMALPGVIAHSRWGWPGISYFCAGFALFCSMLWACFADSSPIVSKRISPKEKAYILSSQRKRDEKEKKIPIPWKAMLTSVPFASMCIVRFTFVWGSMTIQTQIPTYLHSILGMEIQRNSMFSSFPYFVMLVMAYVYLIFADVLLKKNIFSLTVVKKTINSIAMWIPAISFIALGFISKNQTPLAIVLMTITIGLSGGVTIGSALNAIDLAANHAVVLLGIVNTLASISNTLAPLYVGLVLDDETNLSQWQIIFCTAGGMYFFGNLQFLIFGTTETQPWNDEKYMLVNQDEEPKVQLLSSKLKSEPKTKIEK